MGEHHDSPDHAPAPAEETTKGTLALARERSLVLARAGATDEQIEALLRVEYCHVRPPQLAPSRLAASFSLWHDDLEDARIAGEADQLAALHAIATTDGQGRAQAAIFLAKRREHLDGLEREVLRTLRHLLTLPPAQLPSELEKLRAAVLGRAGFGATDA